MGRLIVAGNGAKSDGQAIPKVDRADGIGQINDFFLVKMSAKVLVGIIRHVCL